MSCLKLLMPRLIVGKSQLCTHNRFSSSAAVDTDICEKLLSCIVVCLGSLFVILFFTVVFL